MGPDIFHASEDAKRIVFGVCLLLAVVCVTVGAIKERADERKNETRPGHRRRMIALIGMWVSGFSFVGFAGAYFWPSSEQIVKTEKPTPAKVAPLPVGTVRYVIAKMIIEVKEDLSHASGRIEVEIHNDSDRLVKFHAITAGWINGVAFDGNKVEFDGYIYAHDSSYLVSNRLPSIPLPKHLDPDDPALEGVYEYELHYRAVEEDSFTRHSARGIRINQWIPLKAKPAGTQVAIPVRVVLYNEIEE